jgi:hypothetical protein
MQKISLINDARVKKTYGSNWAQLVGRQWGMVTQKTKKGVEGQHQHPGASTAAKAKR